VHQTAETILRLAELGNVILLGRGANVITAKLPGVFHVRLVASLDQRLERTQHFERMNRKEALRRIQQQDRGRNRYVKKYFGKDADDPLLYHMIINTDLIPLDRAARILGNAILEMDNRR
jgi:cytidylate kinase